MSLVSCLLSLYLYPIVMNIPTAREARPGRSHVLGSWKMYVTMTVTTPKAMSPNMTGAYHAGDSVPVGLASVTPAVCCRCWTFLRFLDTGMGQESNALTGPGPPAYDEQVRVLVIDNYDSFTFNLVQYLGELGADPIVARNDDPAVADVAAVDHDALVISPGPGTPAQAGCSAALIEAFGAAVRPVLGVCLGHQVIIDHFGGTVGPAEEVRHGKTSEITHDGQGVFAGIPDPMTATRYHSLTGLVVPDVLEVTARAVDDGTVQGVRHRTLPIHGVQFHPESVLTADGKALLANFLDLV